MHIRGARNDAIPRNALRLARHPTRGSRPAPRTEAQSFPKACEPAVMTVRAACGRSVPFHDVLVRRHVQADAPDDESADGRDDAHPIRNGFTIRGLRQAEE